jgi:hypothetical protein
MSCIFTAVAIPVITSHASHISNHYQPSLGMRSCQIPTLNQACFHADPGAERSTDSDSPTCFGTFQLTQRACLHVPDPPPIQSEISRIKSVLSYFFAQSGISVSPRLVAVRRRSLRQPVGSTDSDMLTLRVTTPGIPEPWQLVFRVTVPLIQVFHASLFEAASVVRASTWNQLAGNRIGVLRSRRRARARVGGIPGPADHDRDP